MPGSEKEPRRAVIITALALEFNAVRAYLRDVREEKHNKGTLYEVGRFEEAWEVALVQTGMGNMNAAMHTERAINQFKPEVMMFVGIAGGIKDVALGDVVAATKVYHYEPGRAGTSFNPRPEAWQPTHTMEQRAFAVARNDDWKRRMIGGDRLPDGRSPGDCEAFTGPIAAGEQVIASIKADVARLIKATFGDTLAVEMEGAGFLQAIHANLGTEALVIRGISDLVENKGETDKRGWQRVAARHASAFAFEVLAKLAGDGEQQGATVPGVSAQGGVSGPSSVSVAGSGASFSGHEPDWGGSAGAIRIYYSYADEDKDIRLLRELQKQLAMLRINGLIAEWDRSYILPHMDALGERLRYVDSADMVLLAVSSDYMNAVGTDPLLKKEYERCLLQRTAGKAVIPIMVRPVADWQKAQLGGIQGLPRRNREKEAISDYRGGEQDRILMQIAQDIRNVVESLCQVRNVDS
ncbi:MAG: 5'-methylthioadenosine/S-adenosylhomocysteine nucleosidase [Ktedonobacteraceae bacterium]|nr:5'-methylthioadenosine/S-adenosylhomocysteine nucleosidase [Ktedonobacteraceae bacterium]MBO0792335.1 5'-methylthioadenosine/S-adenosylhomocysteine nucleosidase [Ktedonobacteraceae bacterium]